MKLIMIKNNDDPLFEKIFSEIEDLEKIQSSIEIIEDWILNYL